MAFVNQVILDEPRRFNMMRVVAAFKSPRFAAVWQNGFAPACGTVGCHVGWTGLVLRLDADSWLGSDTVARLLSGSNEKLRHRLHNAYFQNIHQFGADNGTLAYAERIVADRFLPIMHDFKRYLKARKIQVYPSGSGLAPKVVR